MDKEQKRIQYWTRKKNGLCVRCGREDAYTMGGRSLCFDCAKKDAAKKRNPEEKKLENEWRRKRYSVRRKAGLCTRCGREDAYTMAGRSLCSDCAEQEAARKRKRREKDPEAKRLSDKRLREKRRKEGLCLWCGKPIAHGNYLCERCKRNDKVRRHERRIAAGINWPRGDNGICWQCNMEPVIPGKKLCPACYEKALDSIQHCREAARDGRKNHFWRRDNEIVYHGGGGHG